MKKILNIVKSGVFVSLLLSFSNNTLAVTEGELTQEFYALTDKAAETNLWIPFQDSSRNTEENRGKIGEKRDIDVGPSIELIKEMAVGRVMNPFDNNSYADYDCSNLEAAQLNYIVFRSALYTCTQQLFVDLLYNKINQAAKIEEYIKNAVTNVQCKGKIKEALLKQCQNDVMIYATHLNLPKFLQDLLPKSLDENEAFKAARLATQAQQKESQNLKAKPQLENQNKAAQDTELHKQIENKDQQILKLQTENQNSFNFLLAMLGQMEEFAGLPHQEPGNIRELYGQISTALLVLSCPTMMLQTKLQQPEEESEMSSGQFEQLEQQGEELIEDASRRIREFNDLLAPTKLSEQNTTVDAQQQKEQEVSNEEIQRLKEELEEEENEEENELEEQFKDGEEKIKAQNAKLIEDALRKTEEIQRLKEELEEEKQRTQQLAEQVATEKESSKQLNQQLYQEMQERLISRRATLQLAEEKIKLEVKIKQIEEEINVLRQRETESQQQLEQSNKKTQQLAGQAETEQAETEQAETEKENSKKLMQQLAEEKQKNKLLEEKNKEIQNTTRILQQEDKNIKSKQKEMTEELDRLRNSIEIEKQKNKELQTTIQKVQQEKIDIEKKQTAMTEEIQRLKEELEEEENEEEAEQE